MALGQAIERLQTELNLPRVATILHRRDSVVGTERLMLKNGEVAHFSREGANVRVVRYC